MCYVSIGVAGVMIDESTPSRLPSQYSYIQVDYSYVMCEFTPSTYIEVSG
jgi:hypothetical protein